MMILPSFFNFAVDEANLDDKRSNALRNWFNDPFVTLNDCNIENH